MKNNNNFPRIGLPAEACEACGFTGEDTLELHAGDSALVILKDKMTVLEVAYAVETLSALASELTVALAKAGGICNNCGEHDEASPAERAAKCSLCQDILEGSGIAIPNCLLGEAGIAAGAKLEAYTDEDSGEITVVESEHQFDLTDLPSGVLAVLAASGVCLAELDERIMLEEHVYGK